MDITVDYINNDDLRFDLSKFGKKIVGTYDYKRQPGIDEIVIIIGDYPASKESLISNNFENKPIYRNYKWALNFKYDYFEGNSCWDHIDTIYIINSDNRPDRLFDILKEFKKMQVPLNKVIRQSAIIDRSTDNDYVNGLVGCFKSHISILEKSLELELNNIAVFEDDFTFSDPIDLNIVDIDNFFKKEYEYDVLLLSTSAEGIIDYYDDLISLSKQPCTTTSGYILSKNGISLIYHIWTLANKLLVETGDFNTYACDRYWSIIQKDHKMITFNRKIGYQRPSISQTLNMMVYNLD